MSGTTDPVVLQRISILKSIKASLLDIISKVQNGQMLEANIPITQAAYNNFLPALKSPTSALPQLLSDNGMSSTLNSLFPIYGAGDASGANLARDLFGKYAGNLMKNISWDLNISSASDAEQQVAQELMKGLMPDADNITYGSQGAKGSQGSQGAHGPYPEREYEGAYDKDDDISKKGYRSVPSGAPPKYAPVRLDWKQRSQQICDQVSKRGMDPYEFGCLKNTDSVDANFSFRGYARMVCNRLATNYDPGVPELCGCPPPSWPGWRP